MWPTNEARNVFFDEGERPFSSMFDWLLFPSNGENGVRSGLMSLTRMAIRRTMMS